ncbi:dicarboxylate/amino acid:cation symporter [Sansalvadorimonas sp. 2012CJ34-2]|uniref:Dicarboxylate/amino acid:cation symporter n=1 Tax=Parendozoicomonas callyspongiae TaxID=2942213 RepID=A0ABT0PD39_9GAMM|nr:dicarboxylate/amino acid:cation symporter [Sansalvadorimonas sp. 2012CJ34-2]MCL6269279.1 dicarboxylate/amino acid:cation symporter [Sansalvadorimonas sp. 2012CJ34-2]
MSRVSKISTGTMISTAALLGITCGFMDVPVVNTIATTLGDLFIRLLKLVSTPIIFFSVLSTLTGMGNLQEAGILGGRVFRYTLMTTLIAASIALSLFLLLDPANHVQGLDIANSVVENQQTGYLKYLVDIIPTSFIEPFAQGQVISVLFLAVILSLAILTVPVERRTRLQQLFEDLFAAIMKLTAGILKLLPIAVWAFVTTFLHEITEESIVTNLALYFLSILLANLVQALVVLPLLLSWKGLSPVKTFKGMFPALSVAFFAKSSSAALPVAMEAARSQLGVSERIARFSFPLCTTINMNACAGFILITVLFVSSLNGMSFSPVEMFSWIFIATIAAIGNAGVPMGCFLLASTLLATMNVPLALMGVILPVYALIDMLESAINVWSDACVTCIVDKETESSPVVSRQQA